MALDHRSLIADYREELRARMKMRAQNANNEQAIASLTHQLNALALRITDERDRTELLVEISRARRKPPGLQESILDIMQENPGRSLTPVQVRTKLKESGFDLMKYSQDLATISIALRRLALKKRSCLKRRVKNRNVSYSWVERPENGWSDEE